MTDTPSSFNSEYFLTFKTNVWLIGAFIPVPSNTILSPPSKSCSSSKNNLDDKLSPVFPSNSILSWKVEPFCSWIILSSFSKVVVNSLVPVSNDWTVPVCPFVVRVLPKANVPDTSFKTKCALGSITGAFETV